MRVANSVIELRVESEMSDGKTKQRLKERVGSALSEGNRAFKGCVVSNHSFEPTFALALLRAHINTHLCENPNLWYVYSLCIISVKSRDLNERLSIRTIHART